MIVFFYEKVRLKRGVWQTVSIVLLIAFLCAFFTLFDGFICQKEQDMESAYAVIPVTVVVSNLTGTKTDDLKITDYIINYFLSDKYAYGGELQEKAFSSYVKDVCLKASVYYSQGTGFSSRQMLMPHRNWHPFQEIRLLILKDTTNQFLPQIKQRVLFRPQRQKNCRKILIIMVMSY